MVVHVEHAAAAGGAVVRALGLEDVALQAVALALLVQVAHPEAPVRRHAARVRLDRLEARRHHHRHQEREPPSAASPSAPLANCAAVC